MSAGNPSIDGLTPAQPGFRPRLRDVILTSLSFTAVAAIAAGIWRLMGAQHGYFVAFVCLRWSFVGLMALLPAAARLLRIRHVPFVFATPWTAIALTGESIVVDIICAQLLR